MNSFKKLTRRQKNIILASAFITVGCLFADRLFGSSDDYAAAEYPAYSQEANFVNTSETQTTNPMNSTTQSNPGDGQKVVIYDKGLQMPVSTVILPDGWRIDQDIAFDPNTARPVRYKLEYTGPNGEFSRGFAEISPYGAINGKSFEQAYREAIPKMIGNELTQVSVGNIKPSPEAEALPQFQKMAQKLGRQGMRINALEIEISGQRNGQPYRGLLGFVQGTQNSAMGEMGMLLPATIFVAPANQYEQALNVVREIGRNTVSNPAYEQRMDQINQRVMQQMQVQNQQRSAQAAAAHRQRMANNQAAFNAHQQNMQSMSQAQDASYNSYMNGLRNSGSYNSTGSNYSSHDAFIDQMHERSTFNDPYSGQEMNLDGQYDYNYTNGLGDYYRTDDPSFDPNSLQGDWQQIEPQYPY
jgi:two-component sensor histidine kinase